MAAALLVLLLLHGSSGTSPFLAAFDHAKPAIKAEVGDKTTRKEALAILDKAESATKKHTDSRAKTEGELLELVGRHDANGEELTAALDRINAGNEAFQDELIGYRLELKSKLSREEWARIFPPKAKP